MDQHINRIVPFSLKDAPSVIERIFPSLKVSAEAQKERKAGPGQILTALGSFWKGRKPLFVVRACILGTLLPATNNTEVDLQVFEALLGIDEQSFRHRVKRAKDFPSLLTLPYEDRMKLVNLLDDTRTDVNWSWINGHLGTSASSMPKLVEQLGIMRYGRIPSVADTFAGGGSIPFEAARLGCDVYASDLNPIACLLSWGALNIVGATTQRFEEIEATKAALRDAISMELAAAAQETDAQGNVAKAYIYCMETKCPDTGWMVPMLPSRIVSKTQKVVAVLVPDKKAKRYDIQLECFVDDETYEEAATGTMIDGRLVHPNNPNRDGVAISTIRGDYKKPDGTRGSRLRVWEKSDFRPLPEDIFQERLYCIHWIKKDSLKSGRFETFFAAPSKADLQRDAAIADVVQANLSEWQNAGLVPDMAIEPGEETSRLQRERGWSFWHHLFTPREIHSHAIAMRHYRRLPALFVFAPRLLDNSSKLARWYIRGDSSGGSDFVVGVFYNQALNTLANYANRSSFDQDYAFGTANLPIAGKARVHNHAAKEIRTSVDIYVTDPPYADAVNYHEITEYFIAWLRKNPPAEFANWNWDSRRLLAIKGKGEEFRASMVDAYKAMTNHMPENGVQIVMFTHQDGKVWSDMAQIFWGAGLQVMADWYIATETTSELKKGGYVQGTHLIVLKKRRGNESGYADEITQEVKEEVASQIEEMVGLNQSLKGNGRSENLFNDADLQMAGYAAALRVLTKYVKIDGKDMTVEALRPRGKSERTNIDEIIEYAVQVANEHLVPEGMTEQTWRRLTGPERFYLKMMDIETTGAKKVDNYQNFAKAFRVADYGALMSSVGANNAALKSAAGFGKRQMADDEFGSSLTRAVLYGLWEMGKGVEDDTVLEHVRDLTAEYLDRRGDLVTIASYIAGKRSDVDRKESQNAGILAGLIKNQRIG